jgi:hypothetical protein
MWAGAVDLTTGQKSQIASTARQQKAKQHSKAFTASEKQKSSN